MIIQFCQFVGGVPFWFPISTFAKQHQKFFPAFYRIFVIADETVPFKHLNINNHSRWSDEIFFTSKDFVVEKFQAFLKYLQGFWNAIGCKKEGGNQYTDTEW